MSEECPCCGERNSVKLLHLKYEDRPGNQCCECGCIWDSDAFIRGSTAPNPEREARTAAVVGGERDGRNESAPPAAAVGQEPVAWMTEDGRTCNTATRNGMHAALQASFSIPLYAAPSVDEHLPDLGSHGPAASSGDGTSVPTVGGDQKP